MVTTVKQMNKEEVIEMKNKMLVGNRLGLLMTRVFEQKGWTIHDYHISKKFKGYELVIEFCIGDFCTYIGSKKNGYLLERKIPHLDLGSALVQIGRYQKRINNGETWVGEDD